MEKVKNEICIILPLLSFFSLLSTLTYSQTFNVQGNVSTNLTSVRYASVTFIDETNTSNRYLTLTDTTGNYQLSIITDVENKKPIIPQSIELGQNYPNPFNPITNIGFRIAEFRFVSLKIYDVLGREVATLVNEEKPAGEYEVEFDGSNLSSGIYFYVLSAGEYRETNKMCLIK